MHIIYSTLIYGLFILASTISIIIYLSLPKKKSKATYIKSHIKPAADDVIAISAIQVYPDSISHLVIRLSNDKWIAIMKSDIEILAAATEMQTANIRIEGDGYYLQWPDLNVDLYVPSLIKGITGTKAWMDALQAQANAELSTYLPEFNCFQTNTYWPGQSDPMQFEKKTWIVIERPIMSRTFANGTSELEAVRNAIKRCKTEGTQYAV